MTRPLHLEFAGALYQLTARGDRQAAIFVDDSDRRFIVTPLNAAMTQKAKDLLQKYGKIKALRALDAL